MPGLTGPAGPDFLTVDYPLFPVLDGGGGEASKVRTRPRLAEQLAPVLLAREDRPQKPCSLPGRPSRMDGGRALMETDIITEAGRGARSRRRRSMSGW